MTVVFYSYFNQNISKDIFEERVRILPSHMAKRIREFRRWQDALASLYGKLLLKEGLVKFGSSASLKDVLYTKYNKPYIREVPLCFNISRSGNHVVCAVSNEVDTIGIDVEEIKRVNIKEFQDVWNKEERGLIAANNDVKLFYNFWTRKEAVVKADGRGLGLQLNMIDVRGPMVELNNKLYFLKTLDLHPNYVLHLALPKKIGKVDLIESSFDFVHSMSETALGKNGA